LRGMHISVAQCPPFSFLCVMVGLVEGMVVSADYIQSANTIF
jgi:hypothetical protein